MSRCKLECKHGNQQNKCCLECEKYPECPGLCDTLDLYEFIEDCPDYVKEEEE